MKNKSFIRKVFDKLFPVNTMRRNFIRKRVYLFNNPLDNNVGKDSKFKMVFRLFYMSLFHPKRAYYLITKIKKNNLHYGDHHADICFLSYGNINFKKEDKPMVSIIIPVYNQFIYTYKCLKSIYDNTKDVNYEVIIADDVSNDGTVFLSSYVKNINVIRNKENLRFLKNCNNAAKYARGKYILFLNNDTQVKPEWLSSLVDLIESDKTIGMVGSKLIFPNGLLQEAGGIICREGNGYNYGKFDDANKPQYNYVRDVDYISGCAIMLSKKLWDQIGGFDELFAPAYCEDSDLAFEVRKRGYRVVYQPKSVVVHFEGVSNGTDINNSSNLKHYQIENSIKLRNKWKNEFKLLPSTDINKMNINFRDRINGRKVVLVIDHYVPEYDKDAGSKTTFQYLKMFVEKGFIVKFLGDNFYQSEPYTTVLQQMGIEVLYGVDYRDTINDWIIENKDNIDVVYMNRPHISAKYIDFFKENTEIKIIYYGHDLHFLREKREYEITNDNIHLLNSDYWKNIELDIMKKADQVYYPSYIERDLIKSIDSTIDVKAINAYVFDNIKITENIDFTKRKGIMFVGGFTHRPNVDAIIWFAKEIYPLIKKKKNIPLYIVGSKPPKEVIALGNIDGIIVKGYVTDEELDKLYNSIKISIAPLRYGAGIKGKVIEAMSQGIPVVTTTTGAEGITGIEKIIPVTDDPRKYAEELVNLYNDDKKLLDISNKLKKYIDENFGTEAAWNIIKNDFVKRHKYVIFTPDGFGSKGDEAMIRGILNILNTNSVRIITQNQKLWTKNLSDLNNIYCEEYHNLEKLSEIEYPEKNCIVIGADLIDGTQDKLSSISRLKAVNKVAKNGGICHIFCSFRSDVDPEIIKTIKSLPENVYFNMRDQLSIKNFVNQTRKSCNFFPDLGFFASQNITDKTTKFKKKISNLKLDYNCIGINFSETSFRSLYGEFTDDNRKKYISDVIDLIINKIDNPYLILISHDCRGWENYYSDEQYCDMALSICKDKGFDNVLKLDGNLMHSEIVEIIKDLDTVISGRMHLSIASFKAHVIPIIYTGSGKQKFSMNDKMHGMFINRINDDSFVTHNINDLEIALKKVIYNYYECLEKIEFLKTVELDDQDKLNLLKEQI